MDEQVRDQLNKKLCIECMKVYTDFVDKSGNRICHSCDKRKKKEAQKVRRYITDLYFKREFGGSK